MQKIYLICAQQKKTGGKEVYLSRFADALNKSGINHKIISSKLPKFLPTWLSVILFNFLLCLRKKNKFYFSLERISCADVYRAGDGVHKVFLKYIKKSNINPLHFIYLYLEKKCFTRTKIIIANSKMVKTEIIETYGINKEKIKVIYNGVNFEGFEEKKACIKLNKEFSISKKEKIILFVGSGFKRKGLREFLHILTQLKYFNWRAFVVGKEKKMHTYQQLAQQLGIKNKVTFTGMRGDVDDFYAMSDIFILPTYYDPFSNVVLEAMNFENVVFTTKQNGASEILEPDFIMQNASDLSIVKTLERLLKDNTRLNQIKCANLECAKQYSMHKNFLATLDIIGELEVKNEN